MWSVPRLVFLSDSCLLAGGRPLARHLEHLAQDRPDADRIRSCLRDAYAEYARGSDPAAVAAGLLGLLHGADRHTAAGIAWLDGADGRRRCPRLAAALSRHRRRGDSIVLVTELVQPSPAVGLLDGRPVAVIGSRLPYDAMAGQRRTGAMAAYAAAAGSPLERCQAYGRAVTDLPMMRAVGDPIVVGAHPTLLRAAAAGGWRSLDTAGPALPPPRVVDPHDPGHDLRLGFVPGPAVPADRRQRPRPRRATGSRRHDEGP